MIKYISLGLLMFLCTASLLGQKAEISLQANLNLQYLLEEPEIISFYGPSVSILFLKANGTKQQFEWSNFQQYNSTAGSLTTTYFNNAFRYEASRVISSAKGKLRWQMGGSTTWTQYAMQEISTSPDQFQESKIGSSLILHVVPAAIIDLSDRVYLELGLPIQLVSMDFFFARTQDPSVPLQPVSSFINFEQQLGGGFMFRTGIGVRL